MASKSYIEQYFPATKYNFRLISNNPCKIKILIENINNDLDKYLLFLVPSEHHLEEFTEDIRKIGTNYLFPKEFFYSITLASYKDNPWYENYFIKNSKIIGSKLVHVHETPENYAEKLEEIKLFPKPEYFDQLFDKWKDIANDEYISYVDIFETLKMLIITDIRDKFSSNGCFQILISKTNGYFDKIISSPQILMNIANKQYVNSKYMIYVQEKVAVILARMETIISEYYDKEKDFCVRYYKKIIYTIISDVFRELKISKCSDFIPLLWEEKRVGIKKQCITHERNKNNKFIYITQSGNYNIIGTPDPINISTDLNENIKHISYILWIFPKKDIENRDDYMLYSLRDLRAKHIELLKFLKKDFTDWLSEKFTNLYIDYNIINEDLSLGNNYFFYVMYPQSKTWSFNVRVSTSVQNVPERYSMNTQIHILEKIINNLTFDEEFYARVAIDYVIRDYLEEKKVYNNQKGGSIIPIPVNTEEYMIRKKYCKHIYVDKAEYELAKKQMKPQKNLFYDIEQISIEPTNIPHGRLYDFLKNIKFLPKFYNGQFIYFTGEFVNKIFYPYKILQEKRIWYREDIEYFKQYVLFQETIEMAEIANERYKDANVNHIKATIRDDNKDYGYNVMKEDLKNHDKYVFEDDNFFVSLNPGVINYDIIKKNLYNITIYFLAWWKKVVKQGCNKNDSKFLHTIRNLNGNHLPMLIDFRNHILEYIKNKFNVEKENINIFFNYPTPISNSIIHIQILFTLNNKESRLTFYRHMRAISLNEIINILEIYGDYFKRVNIFSSISKSKYKELYK